MKYSLRLWAAACVLLGSSATAQQFSLADDARAFGARDAAFSVDISPSGKRIAMLVPGPGRATVLKLIDLASVAATNLVQSDGKPDTLRWCTFASDDQLVCNFGGNGIAMGDTVVGISRLVSVSADGKTVRDLGQKQNLNSGFRQWDGTMIDVVPDAKGSVLLARYYTPSPGQTGNYNRDTRDGLGVDRVELSTSRATEIEPPRAAASFYMTDGRGKVRIMETTDTDHAGLLTGRLHFFYRAADSSQWKPLGDYDEKASTGVRPIAVDATINAAYVLKKVDGRDALFTEKLDGSGATTLVAANPKVDIDRVIRIGRGQRVVGYTYADDHARSVYFDPEFASLSSALEKALGLPVITFEGASADGSKLLVSASGPADPGHYYLFDKASRHMDEIAAVQPALVGRKLGSVTSVSVPTADHVMIPAYLTLPPSGAAKGLPAVVLPHGGPSYRDYGDYFFVAQFLAARGYAVIQPEFRGSAGFGAEWEGKNAIRDWKTAMSDIAAAARFLVDQGIANPNRLAIVGWSYGGYAALQSVAVEPKLYKGAVAIAPVTDLSLMKAEARDYTSSNLVADFVGSGENIIEGSPVRRAADIKVPVLMFHGDLDLNVNIAQSERMESALLAAGDKAQLVKFPGLDHQLNDSEARTQMLTRIGEFLDAAIGH